jgi:molybdate transport system substrate-binding protein
LSGCKDKPAERIGELQLYCGAGIRPPVAELVETFAQEHTVKIITDYAGSEVLLAKLKLARAGDLYLPGDKHYIDQAAQENMILDRRPACYFVPAILVQKGNPKQIKGLQDLLRADVKVGLGDPKACAIGRKTQRLLAQNNIPWETLQAKLAFQSLTVNELGLQIKAGALDAVIVWDAIARYYELEAQEVTIPVEDNVISTVDIGVLSFTQQRDLAQAFVAFVTSPRGQDIFKRHHYRVDPPQ